jgi:hypothetical protein
VAFGAVAALAADLSVVRPRTEGRVEALALEQARPRFSWALAAGGGEAGGLVQTAFHVRVVARGPDDAPIPGIVWDSGRVSSAADCVRYGGRPLRGGGRYSWQVRVWDADDTTTKWSPPAFFELAADPDRASGEADDCPTP